MTDDDILTTERVATALLEDGRRGPDLVLRVFAMHMEQQHRLTLLAAGMLGLVIPVLANTAIVVAPWCLRRAVYLSAGSVVLGVVAHGLTRAMLPALMRAMQQATRQYASDVGYAQGTGDTTKIAAALTDGADAMQRGLRRRFATVNILQWVLETCQYAAFIAAAIYIARAF